MASCRRAQIRRYSAAARWLSMPFRAQAKPSRSIWRMAGRRVCPDGGATYHTSWTGFSENCQKCGAKLITRNDDKPETVLNRISVYHKQTAPLIDFYKKQGKLVTIECDAKGTPEHISALIKKALQ